MKLLEGTDGQMTFEFRKPSNVEMVFPPLRYPGSKFRAAKHILPFIPDTIDEYREPFFGGGAIFFKLPLAKKSWLNDVDRELMITYKIMANPIRREVLMDRVKNVIPSKAFFDKLKEQQFEEEMDIAYKYFVINRTAYSGIMNKPNFGFHPVKSVQPDKWPQRILEAGKKLEMAELTSMHYRDVIEADSEFAEDKVFLFIDPPYFKADQKRAYVHSFTEADHRELLETLRNTRYKFCLTYDDCEEIRDMYDWANIDGKRWMYNTANSNTTTRKEGKELIITNY